MKDNEGEQKTTTHTHYTPTHTHIYTHMHTRTHSRTPTQTRLKGPAFQCECSCFASALLTVGIPTYFPAGLAASPLPGGRHARRTDYNTQSAPEGAINQDEAQQNYQANNS